MARGRPSKEAMTAEIKAHPAYSSMHWEDDGCFQDKSGKDVLGLWLYLKAGWYCIISDCGTIHEPTLSNALRCLRDAYYDGKRYNRENNANIPENSVVPNPNKPDLTID